MNRSSHSIIIESLSRWKGEQQDDSHEEEEDSAMPHLRTERETWQKAHRHHLKDNVYGTLPRRPKKKILHTRA